MIFRLNSGLCKLAAICKLAGHCESLEIDSEVLARISWVFELQFVKTMNTNTNSVEKNGPLKAMTIFAKVLVVAMAFHPFAAMAEDEDAADSDIQAIDVYDNPNLKLTDARKFLSSEKDVIDEILDGLHKMKRQKKMKLAHKYKTKKYSVSKPTRKIASIKTLPLKGRLLQAKELMGHEYKSYFRVAKLIKKPDRHIHEYVKEAFAEFDKKTRSKARATSNAILAESKRYGFDPFFLLAVIENESDFDIKVKGDAGEIGLMQILPDTGKWICELNKWKWKGQRTLQDPVQNVKIGAAYLNLLRDKFESESQLYISAYNMGPTNVYRALSHKVTPKDYHSKVLEFYISYYKQIKKEFEERSAT